MCSWLLFTAFVWFGTVNEAVVARLYIHILFSTNTLGQEKFTLVLTTKNLFNFDISFVYVSNYN